MGVARLLVLAKNEKRDRFIDLALQKGFLLATTEPGSNSSLTPSAASRDGLVERVSLIAAVQSLGEDAESLQSSIAELEPAGKRLLGEVQEIRNRVMPLLEEAMGPVEEALRALDGVHKKDVHELRCFARPPKPVLSVLEAMCKLLLLPPERIRDADGNIYNDYWRAQARFFADHNPLRHLKEYDRDNIPPHVIVAIEPFIQDESLEPEPVRKCNIFCSVVSQWVRSMYTYHHKFQPIQQIFNEELRVKESELASHMQQADEYRE